MSNITQEILYFQLYISILTRLKSEISSFHCKLVLTCSLLSSCLCLSISDSIDFLCPSNSGLSSLTISVSIRSMMASLDVLRSITDIFWMGRSVIPSPYNTLIK